MAAYVSRQPVAAPDLPRLMRQDHDGLPAPQEPAAAVGISTAAEPAIEHPTLVQIRKSIRKRGPDQLHRRQAVQGLRVPPHKHELTPGTCRERYGLAADYPMVAPSYAAQRSALAKAIGLGEPGAQAPQQAAE